MLQPESDYQYVPRAMPPGQAIDEDTGHPEPGSCGELVVAAWTELAETGGLARSPPPFPLDTWPAGLHGAHGPGGHRWASRQRFYLTRAFAAWYLLPPSRAVPGMRSAVPCPVPLLAASVYVPPPLPFPDNLLSLPAVAYGALHLQPGKHNTPSMAGPDAIVEHMPSPDCSNAAGPLPPHFNTCTPGPRPTQPTSGGGCRLSAALAAATAPLVDPGEAGVLTSNLSAPCGSKTPPLVVHSPLGTLYEEPCINVIKITVRMCDYDQRYITHQPCIMVIEITVRAGALKGRSAGHVYRLTCLSVCASACQFLAPKTAPRTIGLCHNRVPHMCS